MEEHFVTYKQALALKELGFDKPCWCYFVNDVFFDSPSESGTRSLGSDSNSARFEVLFTFLQIEFLN
jgi:hypothetical protein